MSHSYPIRFGDAMSCQTFPHFDDAAIEELTWATLKTSQNSQDYLDFMAWFIGKSQYRQEAMDRAVACHTFGEPAPSVLPQIFDSIQQAAQTTADTPLRGQFYFYLAKLYHHGFGVAQNFSAALDAYDLAIAYGDLRALVNSASMIEDGSVGEPDLDEAYRRLTRAAEHGSSLAKARLVLMNDKDDSPEIYQGYLAAAEQGSGFAMFRVGLANLNGKYGQPVDAELAMSWYSRAARTGFPLAHYMLGRNYSRGEHTAKDKTLAREWFYQGAMLGDERCQRGLALMDRESLSGGDDFTDVLYWLRRAAVQKDLLAMRVLGADLLYRYEQNRTMSKVDSQREGVAWLEAAARLGDNVAANSLVTPLRQGIGCEEDPVKSAHFCLIAAKAGFPEAQGQMGLNYWYGQGVEKDFDQAYAWLNMCALQGEARGLYLLGRATEEGVGCTPDPKEAFRLYQQASARGDKEVDYEIGHCYLYGIGIEKNPAVGVVHLRKAAIAGDERAMTLLGCILYDGDHVLTNYEEAAKWFEKAAAGDHPRAMYYLGILYQEGDGVEQSEETARKWISRAAMAGDEKAQAWMKEHYPDKPEWLVKMMQETSNDSSPASGT